MELYGKIVKYLDNGRNQIFGRVWGILTILLQVGIYVKIDGTEFGNNELIFGFIILTILFIISGLLYSKFGFFSAEVSSRSKENPELMRILNNTEEILKNQGDDHK